ncbi:uncharacterized protein LOC114323862 [Camellia sinensis]|uniref:uncharacterized protein LOC114323862 n=1 Tax=Camellia sinensis TaxID=4442 RepID=UPI00103664CA|nr:uncharacterized protein LOC114323862 [Camellia sinensis]
MVLSRAKELGLIRGFSIGNEGLNLSHLQFDGGTILFCEADWVEVTNVKRILRYFEVVSGLKINYHKSTVNGVGIDETPVDEFASRLNCTSQKLPFKYLGLPLGANPRRKQTWKPVVDMFNAKLARWKRRVLSFAGSMTLIKSLLSNLPIYYMSLFRMPQGIVKKLNKIQSAFLWGDNDLKRRIHLVKWKEATVSKKLGGLG